MFSGFRKTHVKAQARIENGTEGERHRSDIQCRRGERGPHAVSHEHDSDEIPQTKEIEEEGGECAEEAKHIERSGISGQRTVLREAKTAFY